MVYYTCMKALHNIEYASKKTNMFNTILFGFNKLWKNRIVPVRTIPRKRRLPFHFISAWPSSEKPCRCLKDDNRFGHCNLHHRRPATPHPLSSHTLARRSPSFSSRFFASLQSLYHRCGISRNGMKRNETAEEKAVRRLDGEIWAS